jgi:tetratricopeptide (TPR) repeat protein
LARPAIVRATGIEMLARSADPALKQSLAPLLKDRSDLVRAAAAQLFRDSDPGSRATLLGPLLTDPIRTVRHSAARELAPVDPSLFGAADLAGLQKALGEYLQSRQANADMPEAHMAIAGSALAMRRWEAAEAAFRQATDLDPQLDQAWVMLARLRAALGDVPGSESYLAEGLARAPASTGLMFERGNLEARRGNDAAAAEWYRKLLQIDPARTDAWMQLGYSALRMNEGAQAVDAAGRILALEPDNAGALLLSSVGRYLSGDVDGARRDAVSARRADPGLQLPAEIEQLLPRQ